MIVDLRDALARADWEIGRFSPKTKLTFHWAGPMPANGAPAFDPIARAKTFARYHRAKDWGGGARGDGLMYHFVLGDDVVYLARDEDAVLYATGTDANRTSLHALFPIFDGESPTPGIYRAAAWLRTAKGLPTQGHRDEGTSVCPGDEIATWITRPQEDDMDLAELDRRIDAKIAEYAKEARETGFEPIKRDLAMVDDRVDALEKRLQAAGAALGGGQ